MPKRTLSHDSWLMGKLTDSVIAANYINAAMEDSPEMLLIAMRNVAEAHKMSRVAKKAGVNRVSLYKTLSKDGNPELGNFRGILDVLGLTMHVAPKESPTAKTKTETKISEGETVRISQTATIKTVYDSSFSWTSTAGPINENQSKSAPIINLIAAKAEAENELVTQGGLL